MDTVQRMVGPGRFSPTGLRKITPAMLATIQKAGEFKFIEAKKPGKVLAAFKAAAPYLGCGGGLVHAIDFFFALTQPIDWEPGSKPVVWPSAAMQQLSLCLGESQVKRLNRRLVELGLIVMRDSPNGKRYGRRDSLGRIVEAYGIDLSPLAARQAEFEALANKGREDRKKQASLRRRASVARNSLRQMKLTAEEAGVDQIDWDRAERKIVACSAADFTIAEIEPYEEAVLYLEEIEREVRAQILDAAKKLNPDVDKSVDMAPTQAINGPHNTTTNQLNNFEGVFAKENGSRELSSEELRESLKNIEGSAEVATTDLEKPSYSPDLMSDQKTGAKTSVNNSQNRYRSGRKTSFKVTPDNIAGLAPKLKQYLPNAVANWPEIVNAADWLRGDLGISRHSWGEACLVMGREQAAIAIAIVSSKAQDHFTKCPGAYFSGMITKARAGELDLAKSIQGMQHSNGNCNKWPPTF